MFKKNILANYFGQFYNIIIGIVMVPFYLKYLGAEAYGLVGFFALMQSWMALLDLGLSPTLSREVSKVRAANSISETLRFKTILHSLEFIFIILSIIIAVSIVFGSEWITHKWLKVDSLNLDTVSYCIALMGIIIGFRFLTTLYSSGITGAEAQVWLNSANVILNTLRFVGVLAVLHFINNDIELFFEYQLIVTIIGFVLMGYKFYALMGLERFKLYFSYQALKPVLPFALGVAYTGGIWVFLTQMDKFFLSNILSLKEYGYFALSMMVANGVLQLMSPIGQALQPRMISLLHEGKEAEMYLVYKKSTQLMAVVIFSTVGIIGAYSYELLYAWTGNKEIALWAKDILFWYVMGNGILAISSFQYGLQFAHGNLKLHVYYNTWLAIISIPFIFFVAYNYGALGVAILWFVIRLVGFLFWVPFIHNKFVPGLHRDWMIKDILPILLSSILFILIVKGLPIQFDIARVEIFGILILLGIIMLSINSFVSCEVRKMILNILGIKK